MTTSHTGPSIELISCVEEAERLSAELERAEAALRQRMADALSTLMPVDSVIDLRDRHVRGSRIPKWLVNTKTSRGNDRGSRLFRVTSAPRVEVSLRHLMDSSWAVNADPISEKTGLVMSGRSHGADGQRGVFLSGTFSSEYTYELEGEAYRLVCREAFFAVFQAAQELERAGQDLDQQRHAPRERA